MSDEFMEEIQADVRREEFIRFLKQYGTWIIIAIVALVVGSVAFTYWQQHQHEQQVSTAKDYERALGLWSDQQYDTAVDALKNLSTHAKGNQHVLSLFKLSGDKAQTTDALQHIINDVKIDASFSELAQVMLGLQELDHQDSQQIIERLRPITLSNSPWRALAFEGTAIAYLKAGEVNQAKEILVNLIQDESTPQGVKLRAHAILDYIQVG